MEFFAASEGPCSLRWSFSQHVKARAPCAFFGVQLWYRDKHIMGLTNLLLAATSLAQAHAEAGAEVHGEAGVTDWSDVPIAGQIFSLPIDIQP